MVGSLRIERVVKVFKCLIILSGIYAHYRQATHNDVEYW